MANRTPSPLNLAALVPSLPPVKFPTGHVVPMVPFTARAYELWRGIMRDINAASDDSASVNEDDFSSRVDELVALVVPEATPDDLASLGARLEPKLAVVSAAAGAADEVVAALLEAEPKGEESEGNE